MLFQAAEDLLFDDIFLEMDGFLSKCRAILKLEFYHPTGSIKYKTALQILQDLEKAGSLSPQTHIVESSSGNLGVALAYLCNRRRLRFTCVVDPNARPANVKLMEVFGANICRITKLDATGGYLKARLNAVDAILASDPYALWTNQYANLANPTAHEEATAPAILRNVPNVDILVIGAGTTGTLLGCMRHFAEVSPSTRIIAVDALGSVTFGGVAAPRYLPGIGTGVRPPLVDRVDALARPEVVYVDEISTIRMCRRLLNDHGILVGASTGAVAHAMAEIGASSRKETIIVGIAPDAGERYLETVYCNDWVEATLGAPI
jgi:N-(2-amino-2-carboxyethyl)-L-glutamate synthase